MMQKQREEHLVQFENENGQNKIHDFSQEEEGE
jgi:hypothetical protein